MIKPIKIIAVLLVLIFLQPWITLAPVTEAKWEKDPFSGYFAEPQPTSMAYDNESATLYIGTQRGLLINHTPSGTVDLMTTHDGLMSNRIGSLLWDPGQQRLFIGLMVGIKILWTENRTLESIKIKYSDGDDAYAYCLFHDEPNELLYLGSRYGFFIIELATGNATQRSEDSGFIDVTVIDIAYDPQERSLYLAFHWDFAIYDLDSESYEILESGVDLVPADNIRALALDTTHRNLYLGSNRELFQYNLSTGTVKNHTLYRAWGDPVLDFRVLAFDEQRSLMYMGFVSGLVVENTSSGAYMVHDFPGYKFNAVETMCLALPTVKCYLSLHMGGILVFDNSTQTSEPIIMGDGLRWDRVRALAVQPGVSLFLSTEQANTQRFFPATERFETIHDWPASAMLYEPYKDAVFIAARYKVYEFNLTSEKLTLLIDSGNLTTSVSDMAYEPSTDLLYIACGVGNTGQPGELFVFNTTNKNIEHFDTSSGLFSSNPVALALDCQSRTLYIGHASYYYDGISYPGGLTIYEGVTGSFSTLNSSDGLSTDSVDDLVWDSEGQYLWIGSDILNRYHPTNRSVDIFSPPLPYGYIHVNEMTLDNFRNILYFASPYAFWIFDIAEERFYHVDEWDGLLTDGFWCIDCDPSQDVVFLGSSDAGLYLFDAAGYRTLPHIVINPPQSLEYGSLHNMTCRIANGEQIGVVRLYYSERLEGPFQSILMNWSEELNLFTAVIPTSLRGQNIYMYVKAEWNGNTLREPKEAGRCYKVNLVDTTPPRIIHTPSSNLTAGEENTFWVTVEDNYDVARAEMRYWDPISGNLEALELQHDQGSLYYAVVEIDDNAKGNFSYYFWASDTPNEALSPSGGGLDPYKVEIVKKEDTVDEHLAKNGGTTAEFPMWLMLMAGIAVSSVILVLMFLRWRRKKGSNHKPEDTLLPPPPPSG
ncbi:MAG: WD40 repeat domain-containing protein [Thermoplasmata archaeon]|nr:MAG: WD40 repeat domain-containing protein [Thermoplasmata archaeon]